MKCPKCGGNAELSNWGSYIDPDYADFHVECEKCGYHSMGSTEPQKAQEMFEKGMGVYYTNEGWLRQANTEQLAKVLLSFCQYPCEICKIECDGGNACTYNKALNTIVEWLKQPHTNKE